MVDGWEDDFRSERQRRRRRPWCERSVVGPERHAARAVSEKVARPAVQSQRDWAGSVAGAEAPREFAVRDKPPRIADRIFALNVRRPAAVLEVVDALCAHERVLDSTKIDPEMRKLMNEKRTAVQQLVSVDFSPPVGRRPLVVAVR